MTRRRWIYPGNGAEPIEVTADYLPEPRSPLIFGDIPGYLSEGTGLWVEGRAQRLYELERAHAAWEALLADDDEMVLFS